MATEWNECDCCTRQKLVVSGKKTIEFAFDRNGEHQGVSFLERVKRTGRVGLLARSRSQRRTVSTTDLTDMFVRLQSYAIKGRLVVPHQMNDLGKRDGQQLWEFKAGDLRLPFYETNCGPTGLARITHGFVKSGKKTPRKELDLSHGIIREDRKR